MQAGAAGLAATSLRAVPLRAEVGSTNVFLVFSDVSPAVPEPVLRALVTPLAQAGIAFTFSFDIAWWRGTDPLRTAALRRFFSRLALNYSGLGEIALHMQGISKMKPYFQGRTAMEIRARILEAFADGDGDIGAIDRVVTATDDWPDRIERPRGFRAAGLRNLLILPPGNIRPLYEYSDREILRVAGGATWMISESDARLQSAVEFLADQSNPGTLKIALRNIDNLSESEANVLGSAIVERVFGAVANGRINLALPSDFHLQSLPGYRRKIHLVLDPSQPDPPASALEDFARRLADVGIRGLSSGAIAAPAPERPFQPVNCPTFRLPGDGLDAAQDDTAPTPLCWPRDEGGARRATEWVGAALQQPGQTQGIDADGHLRMGRVVDLRTATDIARLDGMLSRYQDAVIRIAPDLLASGGERVRLAAALGDLVEGAGTEFVDRAAYLATHTPIDPVFDKFRREQNLRDLAAPLVPAGKTGREDRLLMKDAELALTYLESRRHERTGLVPATVFDRPGRDFVYDKITMWDIGSYLLGLQSAGNLALLPRAEFLARAEQVLGLLPVSEINGMRLPASEISAKSGRVLTREFNACDNGRLFSALTRLRQEPELLPIIDAKVEEWDIAATISDGIYHNVERGRAAPFYLSHCTHYMTRAFERIDKPVRSPYRYDPASSSQADQRMRLLYAADEIGLLGAEPLLLEAIELGWSPETRYLADVLFTEQAQSYARTGDLVCVSEIPVNQSPWFTYQGLDIGSEARRWGVETVSDDPRYSTETFQRKIALVSSKAAYLWHAVHPHPYSELLMKHVRDRARIEGLGFSTGVFVETGLPVENYSDVNTNSIILQAIAHRLGAGNQL
ncbi:Protein of unknown function [Cribrihabitans marinus]|uniref:DUF3131 domain-containing protein n=1 Tax=Cribrihabitans marinus TaxID=1227549 RepID=A0A1H6Y6S1_9RHOB|nr:DUF3131 domain-containing protein [Cribrihabitans marinus]SEJ36166.1 Protein of unknown function [Cribrihabitans marinus]